MTATAADRPVAVIIPLTLTHALVGPLLWHTRVPYSRRLEAVALPSSSGTYTSPHAANRSVPRKSAVIDDSVTSGASGSDEASTLLRIIE